MRTLESILTEHPFFQGMEKRHMELITGCAKNTVFPAGTYIFREGEEAASFYVIRHGKVALEMFGAEHGPITIETIESSEVLGWSWLFAPYRWHFSSRTIEQTRAIVLDGLCLRNKGQTDHDLGYELATRVAQILMKRLRATQLQLLDVYSIHKRGG
jgi:CRP/FNR family transcriptional regulator, cyclic AMP receptor protein